MRIHEDMPDLLKINLINGGTIAAISLGQIRDWVAIILGLLSIISTLIIIRNNLRRNKEM